ncbi:MAG: GspH/FimT family pseudopilin [Wenzhouxiangellaceae bacterium]|nr:GspH/FimT family pseudopilin [Wenzhouxiangellaceae bacterium]
MISNRSRSTCAAGFTLIELMVGIAVLAILLTVAVPSLQKIIRDNRVTAQANELVAMANLARNEAVRRGINRFSDEQALLRLDKNIEGADGWSGNVSLADGVTAEGCPTGVIRCASNEDVEIEWNSNDTELVLSFMDRGDLEDRRTAVICFKHKGSCEGSRQHRKITIFPSGIVETNSPRTDPLACDEACVE